MRMRLDQSRHDEGGARIASRIGGAFRNGADDSAVDRDQIRPVFGRVFGDAVEIAVGEEAQARHRQAL